MRCCVVGIVFLLACESADEPAVVRAAPASAPAAVAAAPARPALPDVEPDADETDDDEVWDVTDDPDTEDTEDDTEDTDHDHHALIDQDDRCPEDPADRDGFEDDGCPEPASDGPIALDGAGDIAWVRTATGFAAIHEYGDSTIELVMRDRDHDLATDEQDPCPDEPEDVDGWQDDDGCPDPDVGGDVVLDGD